MGVRAFLLLSVSGSGGFPDAPSLSELPLHPLPLNLKAQEARIGAVDPAPNRGAGWCGLCLLAIRPGTLLWHQSGTELLELGGGEYVCHITEHGLAVFAKGRHLLHESLKRSLTSLHPCPHGIAVSGLSLWGNHGIDLRSKGGDPLAVRFGPDPFHPRKRISLVGVQAK